MYVCSWLSGSATVTIASGFELSAVWKAFT
jgi:hypothetical protein